MVCEKKELVFGNDISRIVRGIAIILMVTNHCCPGEIIPFEVPLFTFLAGYGYAFARERNLRYSLKRVWHLLSGFWIILFTICVPVAVFYSHYKFDVSQLLLNMFGMWPGLNCYCWYIYFYIFAMAIMPLISRIIDRSDLSATLCLIIIFGGGYFYFKYSPDNENFIIGVLKRCCQWMPLVIGAYYCASHKIYSKVKYTPGWKAALVAFVVMVSVYLMRYFVTVRAADLITVPAFTAAVSVLFHSVPLKWCSVVLTELGMKSMNIWFLHALFFTSSTRFLFLPLVSWAEWPPIRVFMVLLISYILAVMIDAIRVGVSRLFSRISQHVIKVLPAD